MRLDDRPVVRCHRQRTTRGVVPEGALLAARLDQLAPEERGVLECGTVEGRVFHGSAVHVLTEDSGNLQEKLLGPVCKELVRPERGQLRVSAS